MEQSEQDFRDVARRRDEPPDEPHRHAVMVCEACGSTDLFGRARGGLHYIVCERCDHERRNYDVT